MFRTSTSLLLLITILLASSAGAAEVTLKLQHFLDDDSFPHQALIEPWARQIEKDSGGRIKVEIYPAMSLGGKAPDLVDQVISGDVDIIWTAAAYTPGRFPRSEVYTLPLVYAGDPVATNLALMQALETGLAADFREVHPLLLHVQAGHALHVSGKPVLQLDDFKGLELRPAGRGVGKWLVEALGAVPTKKRHPKLPKALARHRLDGAFMSFQLANAMGVIDSVKSHTQLEGDRYFGTSLYLFLMNKQRYEHLPPQLREVIDRNSGMLLAKKAGMAWAKAEQEGIQAALKLGHKINYLALNPPVRERLEALLLRWADGMNKRGINGLRLIKEAREGIARNRMQSPAAAKQR